MNIKNGGSVNNLNVHTPLTLNGDTSHKEEKFQNKSVKLLNYASRAGSQVYAGDSASPSTSP